MKSREDRIISKLEFIEYVCENYPQILIEWKSYAGVDETPADATDEHPKVQLRNVQR